MDSMLSQQIHHKSFGINWQTDFKIYLEMQTTKYAKYGFDYKEQTWRTYITKYQD